MGEFVLHLRGLPYSSTEQSIADFLGVDQNCLSNITIGRHSDGRHSGEAYVIATDQGTAEQCLLQHKQTMPGTHRYKMLKKNEKFENIVFKKNIFLNVLLC